MNDLDKKKALANTKEYLTQKSKYIAWKLRIEYKDVLELVMRTTCDNAGTPIFASQIIYELEHGKFPFSYNQLDYIAWLTNCLKIISPLKLLSIIEKKSLRRVLHLDNICSLLDSSENIPFYTIVNLEKVFGAFIPFLLKNKKELIEKGLTESIFEDSKWLNEEFSPIYYTRIPAITYAGLGEGTMWSAPTYDDEIIESTPHHERPFIFGLDKEKGLLLEKKRKDFFEVKLKIIQKIYTSLCEEDVSNFWCDCCKIIESLNPEDVEFLLHMDKYYYGRGYKLGQLPRFVVGNGTIRPGGLSDIIGLIGLIEGEIKIGSLSIILKEHAHLFKWDIKTKHPSSIYNNYIQLMSIWGDEEIELILDKLEKLKYEEDYHIKDFEYRVNDYIETDILKIGKRFSNSRDIDVLEVDNKLNNSIEDLLNKLIKRIPIQTNQDDVSLNQTQSNNLVTFPTPEGTKWEDVTIEIVSNDSIRVRANDTIQTYLYSDIGFLDGRKRDLPNSQWYLLKDFADGGGVKHWGSPNAKKGVRKSVQALQKTLRKFFQIETPPIHRYDPQIGWVTKFCIKDKSHGTR